MEEEVPAPIEEEDDEDYKYDDDFEEADSALGVTAGKKQGAGGDPFQGTLSQSGLPPLASGKFDTQTKIITVVEDSTSDNGPGGKPNSKPNRLPTDFNLNIAESANSIDFDISDSHRGGTFVSQGSLPIGQNLSSGLKDGP